MIIKNYWTEYQAFYIKVIKMYCNTLRRHLAYLKYEDVALKKS